MTEPRQTWSLCGAHVKLGPLRGRGCLCTGERAGEHCAYGRLEPRSLDCCRVTNQARAAVAAAAAASKYAHPEQPLQQQQVSYSKPSSLDVLSESAASQVQSTCLSICCGAVASAESAIICAASTYEVVKDASSSTIRAVRE